MATLAQIRTAADNWLAARWPTVQARQATYFANHGRYWQGLWSHSIPPADGIAAAPDQLAQKPSYQAEDWTNAGINDATWLMSISIDQYIGPNGPGYFAVARVTVSGTTYERGQDGTGAEPWRTFGWRVVPTPPAG